MTEVLRKLAEVVEKINQEEINKIQAGNQQRIHFVRQKKPAGNTNQWRIEVSKGNLQPHTAARHGAVDYSQKISTAGRTDCAMGRGPGVSL